MLFLSKNLSVIFISPVAVLLPFENIFISLLLINVGMKEMFHLFLFVIFAQLNIWF